MRLKVLGAVAMEGPVTRFVTSSRNLRSLLAALAVNANTAMATGDLVDWMWLEDANPLHGPAALHTCVSRLRGFLRRCEPDTGRPEVRTEACGYRLCVDPNAVDAFCFERLLADAASLVRSESLHAATVAFDRALDLWTGPALADVTPTRLLTAEANRLTELKLAAQEERLQLKLRLGQAAIAASELAKLTTENPLREGYVRLYMLALHRCGRRSESLAAYRGLYEHLRDELGIEPSRPLRRLYTDLLNDAEDVQPPSAAGSGRRDALQLLPGPPMEMLHRPAEMARLEAAVAAGQPGLPRTAVITGPPGVGKTALALEYAFHHQADFPDGQYFLSLLNEQDHPIGSKEALLAGLTLLSSQSPGSCLTSGEAREAFQEALGCRRVLIILDGAVGAAQVEPLLAGYNACFLITSSRQLHDLATGSRLARVNRLSHQEGEQLLRQLRPGQVIARSDPVPPRLVDLCEGLPLAIKVVAAHLATGCYETIRAATTVLAHNSDSRLSELQYGALDLHRSYSKALAACSPAERLALNALSLATFDKAHVDTLARATAPVQGNQSVTARQALLGLVQANLLEVANYDRGGKPFLTMTPLCAAFAARIARQEADELSPDAPHEDSSPLSVVMG